MLVLKLSCVTLLLFLYQLGAEARRAQICEGRSAYISCNTGTIDVLHAYYGRQDFGTCPHPLASTTNCYSSQTFRLRSRCNRRRSCHLNASNSVFSDPCRGVHKYLEVTFRCK